MSECYEISALWVILNPHMQVHGCEIDPAGAVFLRVWYMRDTQIHPLEMNIGSPASKVLRQLRDAVNNEARSKRLTRVTGSTIIFDTKLRKSSKALIK